MSQAERRRAGGRSARIAARAAGPSQDERAVRPGLGAGAFSPLTESDMHRIYGAALGLLEELGMGDPIPDFIEAVTAAGGSVDDAGRLRYPRFVVEQAIEAAAKSWVWHGIAEDRSIELSDRNVHFGTAGAAVLMLDHDTQRFRQSTTADLYDLARLADTLEHIHFFARPVVTRDCEGTRELDINTAYAAMVGTSKPIGTSHFRPEHVYETVEMFDMVLGGEGEFRKRPFVCANNTFVVPPLRFAIESAECMVAQVRTGMPINLLSAGQAGATSPAALAGSLTQALAECLAALTSVNLLSPGHPCVMGLWPFVSDLRTGAMSGGSGEEAVLAASAAQLANWLGLPSGVPAGMADSKIPDAQAGHEKGLTVALAAQAGANLVYESAGMLASLLACSLEMMVIDNDLLGAVNRTVRGIEVTDDTLATKVIKDVIFGAGHFLGHAQTLDLMQRDYVYPTVGDRLSPDDWVDAGATSAAQRAHEQVTKVLATHHPEHVDPAVDELIRARFPIRLHPAAKDGTDMRW
ncbi:MAG: trimethylamine methyltransferase family protein [Acidimicrobiia bacterium]|nr:trimethylamine methyltransferase family protein [Acidimicrobiia bacterium]